MDINKKLAEEFKLRQEQVDNAVSLIDDGKTIPFIARYRKELTGSLDDQLLRELNDRLTYLRNLENRKSEVSSSIEEQGKLTDEISAALEKAVTLVEVEDIYRQEQVLHVKRDSNRWQNLLWLRKSLLTLMQKQKNILMPKRKLKLRTKLCKVLWILLRKIFQTMQNSERR